MNEFELIKACFANWSTTHPNLAVGIGDDCLVWNDPEPLVVSVDTAVAGRHFPDLATPEQVAQRAFLPALSDLAAMGAQPAFFTLALNIPRDNTGEWVQRFGVRLRELAEAYGIVLAGGDTTASPHLVVTVSVHGIAAFPLLRSAAQVNDDIWVTGQLGQAAAALPSVLNPDQQCLNPAWLKAYWQPEPPIAFAQQLPGLAHAAMDVSDGLAGDSLHLARSSQVDAHIELSQLPLDDILRATGTEGLKNAVAGGDDYQLLFTASRESRDELTELAFEHQTLITRIGHISEGNGQVHWYDGGRLTTLPWQGYSHF